MAESAVAKVKSIFIYPIKSCRGISGSEASLSIFISVRVSSIGEDYRSPTQVDIIFPILSYCLMSLMLNN
ncbi:hypothetical protein Hanom_Chr02g00111911 [Helianthus anomalus]